MILVTSILKNLFILLCFVLFILELLSSLSSVFLNYKQLNNSFVEVEKSVNLNIENIINSFSFLLVRRINAIKTELMFVGKHMRPFTEGKKLQTIFRTNPLLKADSKYYNEFKYNLDSFFFKDLFAKKESIVLVNNQSDDYLFLKGYSKSNNNDDVNINYLANFILDPNVDFQTQLKTYLETDEVFKKVSYFQTLNNANKGNEFKYLEEISFWMISVKSLFMTSLLNSQAKTIIENYYLFLSNGDMVVYPPIKYNLSKIPYIKNNFLIVNDTCTYNDFKVCFTTFREMINVNKKSVRKIYYDQPIHNDPKNKVIIRTCINIEFEKMEALANTSSSQENEYIKGNIFCIDFSLQDILDEIKKEIKSNKFVFFFSKIYNNPEDFLYASYYEDQFFRYDSYRDIDVQKTMTLKEIDIIYSSEYSFNSIIKGLFDSKTTLNNKYLINSDSNKKLTLFHGLYYSIFETFSQVTYEKEIIEILIEEYRNIIENINAMLKKNDAKCVYNGFNFNNVVNITTSDTSMNLGSWRMQPNKIKETFMISVTPIFLNNTSFDTDHFTYDNEICEKSILFYMISFSLTGNHLLQSKLYFSLLMKLTKSYFLFTGVILFMVILFFISMEIVAKYLIEPVKQIKKLLLKLIRDKSFTNADVEEDEKKSKAFEFLSGVLKNYANFNGDNSLAISKELLNNNFINNEVDYDKEDIFTIFSNIETLQLEELLYFLKKIIMMKKSGDIDYKEKSKIYMRFLDFLDELDERDYYRQCLTIIAYSKYQEQKFEESINFLKDLIISTNEDEKVVLLKNDQLETKMNSLTTLLKKNYINDFTDNDFSNFPSNTQKFLKLRMLKQRIYYFSGLNCYMEYKSHKILFKKDILVEGIRYLKESLNINQQLGINPIKTILTLILISKCYYHIEDYNQSLISAKDALVKFTEFNQMLFEKNLNNELDSRIIFILTNIFNEQIFSQSALICHKLGKKQISANIYNQLLSKCFFISRDFHIDIFYKLNLYLFESSNKEMGIAVNESMNSNNDTFMITDREVNGKNNQNLNNLTKFNKNMMLIQSINKITNKKGKESKFYSDLRKSIFPNGDSPFLKEINKDEEKNNEAFETIKKIEENKIKNLNVDSSFEKARFFFYKSCNRKSNISKHLYILVSDNLIYGLKSNFELRETMLKSVKKYMNVSDIIGYSGFLNKEITSFIPLNARDFNIREFVRYKNFFGIGKDFKFTNFNKNEGSIFYPLTFAIEKMSEFDDSLDQYIFYFGLSSEIRFDIEEHARQLIKLGLHHKTTIYFFVFDDDINKKKLEKISIYLSNFIEAYLVIVRNFKIIEEAFQNVSILGDMGNKRNILNYCYDNHSFIFGGIGKSHFKTNINSFKS